jgi:acylaminoacyl-peptidase
MRTNQVKEMGYYMVQKRKITIDDLYRFSFTGSPEVSPVDDKIVYVVTKADQKNNGYASALFLADKDSSLRRLTFDSAEKQPVKNRHPRFSRSGRNIYFLSDRTGINQVWKLSLDGGEAQPVTDLNRDVTDFIVSPDEAFLIAESSVSDHKQTDNPDITIVERLRYRANGKGFIEDTRALFRIDLKQHDTRLLTKRQNDSYGAALSPDGQILYFLQKKTNPERTDYLADIYRYDLRTAKKSLLYQAKGDISNIQVAHNGRFIAFAGNEDGECSPKNIALWLLPAEGGTARNLTEREHYSLGNHVSTDARFDEAGTLFLWDDTDQSLIYLVSEGPNVGLKRVGLDGAVSLLYLEEKQVVTSFDQKHGRVALVISTLVSTGDLYVLDTGSLEAVKISDHNGALFDTLKLATPVSFSYKGVDGWRIDGWVLFPPDSITSGEKLPVVLEIHGGPASAYGYSFNHEFQVLAAQGYAVVLTNPRGSQGYGAGFCAAVYNDWGRKDKEDILSGLDYAFDHFPELDRSRQYITGGSYGGFMTNTIVGTTHRFTAAVTQRSISNLFTLYETSDIGYYFLSRYFNGADLWQDEEKLMAFSPIRNARKVATPILILHSEEDYRCPIEQAEQWYGALRRLGVETRFVRFRGENHELSRSGKPNNRVVRLQEIIGWFNKHNQEKDTGYREQKSPIASSDQIS